MDEISEVARILAKSDGVTATWEDAEEFIGVLKQENDKIMLGSADSAPPEEIEAYLERLRQQKK